MKSVDKNITANRGGWSFEGLEDEFEAHIRKSVPFYDGGHELICELSDTFVTNESRVYEIGCSNGALTKKFLNHHSNRECLSMVAIDSIKSMVEKASVDIPDSRLELIHGDLVTCELEPCSLALSYYTMQFIHPHFRQNVFEKIYSALNWGGAFIMFEKVRANDARFQDIFSQAYIDFKLKQNFSTDEIIHKAQSLKGVLEPFSTGGNLGFLNRAGFEDVTLIWKWCCFEAYLAIK